MNLSSHLRFAICKLYIFRARKYEDKSAQIVKLLMAAANGDKFALERAYLGKT